MTLLGANGENVGMEVGIDRLLKANTVKKCSHSLFRQRCMWYQSIPNRLDDCLRTPMGEFGRQVRQQIAFRSVFEIV